MITLTTEVLWRLFFFLCLSFICWFNSNWLTSKHVQLALYQLGLATKPKRTSGYVGHKISGLSWFFSCSSEMRDNESNTTEETCARKEQTPLVNLSVTENLIYWEKRLAFHLHLYWYPSEKNVQLPSRVLPLTSSFSHSLQGVLRSFRLCKQGIILISMTF